MFEQPTNQGNSNAQPGQAAPLVSPDTQPQTEAPVYVTKAEISALEEKLRKEMQQTAQSQADKVKNQINKKLETLKAAGITATPEQAQAMIQAEQSQAPETPQQPVTQPRQPAQAAPVVAQTNDPILNQAATWMQEDKSTPDPITAEAYRKMAQSGVRIQDSDPEASLIKGGNVTEWLSSVDAAIEAKQKRLNIKGTPIRTPNLSSGTPSSKPAHADLSAQDTLEAYFHSK